MEAIIKNSITFPVLNKIPKVKQWNTLNKKVPHKKSESYGALCGEKNNFIVIDCDLLKSDDSNKYVCGVDVWSDIVGIIPSHIEFPQVRTKSGGLHLYFKYHRRIKSCVQKYRVCDIFAEEYGDSRIVKIDILSDNKFVVCPGSEGYKYLNNSQYIEPPEMPHILMDLFFEDRDDTVIVSEITIESEVSMEHLKRIVELIPKEYSDNREDWLKIIWSISDTCKKNGYNGLHIADNFSKLSKKYSGIDEVEMVYNQSKGLVTFGTLMYYSQAQETKSKTSDLKDEILVKDMNNIIQRCILKKNIIINTVVEVTDDKDMKLCNLTTDDNQQITIKIYKDNLITTFKDDNFIGYIQSLLKISYDLSVIHPEFKDNCDVVLIDKETIDFVSKNNENGEHRIRVKHPWDTKKVYFTKYSHGKQLGTMRRNKQEINVMIKDALASACNSLLQDRYNINIGTVNIFNNFNSQESVRSEYQLILSLVESHPGILDSFKYCDINGPFKGVFLCGPNTGIWRKENNGVVEKMLLTRIKKYVPGLTDEEIKYIETNRNIQQLRMMFIKEIDDYNFENKIDESRNIFAMNNYVYDFNDRVLRKPIPQDFVFTNTCWDYNESEADIYSEDVKEFFKKLFPISQEHDVVVTFISSLIHGHRLDKKFLALTDNRNGNNGKSTLMLLLKHFFGDYTKTSNKFLLKGAFDKDKDSHDGGLEPLKGKRLLVCDELKKHNKLDEGLIKNLAGGEYTVEGRRLGKSEQFKFMWQAGIIMIFNEGDCPKFDSTDYAFMERMVIVPMRSKFVVGHEDPKSFTFSRDANIVSKFVKWRSSLLKFFLSYAKLEGITKIKIPQSMQEWKVEICNENNILKDWLLYVVEENKEGFVGINDLRDKYKRDFPNDRTMKNKEIERMINSVFNNFKVFIKEQHNYTDSKNKRTIARRVYLGYAMKD